MVVGLRVATPTGELRLEPHVVANEQEGSPESLPHVDQRLGHHPLDDDVERARRLVGND